MISLGIKKELRLILPEWIAAVVLATMPLWCFALGAIAKPEATHVFMSAPLFVLGLAIGCAVLSSAVFGKESSAGTLDQLFMLPISRFQIWQRKVLIAAISIASIVLLFTASLIISLRLINHSRPEFFLQNFDEILWIIYLCSIGPGLWLGIILRRFHEAFWLTLLTPLGLMLTAFLLTEEFIDVSADSLIIGTLFVYGAGTLIATFPMVKNWQASSRLQKALDFGNLWSKKERPTQNAVQQGIHSAFRSLIFKELRIHQLSLVVTVTLALIYVGFLISMKQGNWTKSLVLDLHSTLRTGWLLIPMMIGVAAIAEERALGVISWHATLPISRRQQWCIKLGIVLTLSFVLGCLVPWPIDLYVASLKQSADITSFIRMDYALMLTLLRWAFPIAIGLVGFYASSLSRNLLQGLLVSGLLLLLLWVQISLTASSIRAQATMNPIFLQLLVTAALYTPILLYGSAKNYANAASGPQRIAPDIARWCAAWLLTTTIVWASFNRVWDGWTPLPQIVDREGPQTGLVPTQARIDRLQLTFITDDGRLWGLSDQVNPNTPSQLPIRSLANSRPLTSVGFTRHRRFGVDPKHQLFAWSRSNEGNLMNPVPLTKINEANDWVQLETLQHRHHNATSIYALRENGKLHRAFEEEDGPMSRFEPIPIDASLAMFRKTEHYLIAITKEGRIALIGADPKKLWRRSLETGTDLDENSVTYLADESGWTDIHIVQDSLYLSESGFHDLPQALTPIGYSGIRESFPLAIFEKDDGSYWTSAWSARLAYGQHDFGVDSYSLVQLKQQPFLSIARQRLATGGRHRLIAVRADGTLWAGPRQYNGIYHGTTPEFHSKGLHQVGKRTDWASVTLFVWGQTVFGITENGILWSWGPPHHLVHSGTGRKPYPFRLVPYRQLPKPVYDFYQEHPID